MGKHADHDFSLTSVPESSRSGFWKMFMVMMGFTFFSASMAAGGTLGVSLNAKEFILVVLIGNFLLGTYTGLLSYAAADTGLSTHLLARYSFGEKGSYLASFLLGITQVGWFGVGVAMFALPIEKVTQIDVIWLVIIGGILMTSTAFVGMRALTILSFIAVPAIIILGGFSVIRALDDLGGLQAMMLYEPKESLTLSAAIAICIGSFISGGTLTPDFTRFSNNRRNAVLATVIAFFLGNSLMFLFGGIGAVATGKADISEVMFLQGLIIPAIIVLGLNIWTTNDNALYASGLGFSNITKIPKSKIVLFNGFVGTVLSVWLYNHFVGFLTFLGSTLPPIGAIILADYFLLNRRNYPAIVDMKFKEIHWIAIAAWFIGAISGKFIPGITPLNSLLGAGLSYVVMHAAIKIFQSSDNKKIEAER